MNATELWLLSPSNSTSDGVRTIIPVSGAAGGVAAPFRRLDGGAEDRKSVIFQIGIARFISSRCVLSLCVYMSDDKVRLCESASSALESLRKSGSSARDPFRAFPQREKQQPTR